MNAAEAFRRAGGRRRYNSHRREMASLRRAKVAQLLREFGVGRGVQAAIARRLGVSQATICRDVQALIRPPNPKPTEQEITIREEDDAWEDGSVSV